MADLDVRFDQHSLEATLRRGKHEVWKGARDLGDNADYLAALTDLLEIPELKGQVRLIRMHLCVPLAQVRHLADIPPVQASALGPLIQLQSTRFFRKNGKPLVTSARWSDRITRTLAVAAAAELPLLEGLISAANAAGIARVEIGPAADTALQFVPPASEAARATRERSQLRTALSLALVAWIGVLALDTVQLSQRQRQLQETIETARPAYEAVREVAMQAAVIQQMLDSIHLVQVRRSAGAAELGALLQALPAGSHLTRLEWSATGHAFAAGAGPSAVAVLSAFDAELGPDSLRPEGATSWEQDAGGERERFAIRLWMPR